MRYEKTIFVPENIAKRIGTFLTNQPTTAEESFGEDDCIVYTAVFPDNYEVDVKLCGVRFDENETDNLPYTEAVLFHNGSEVTNTEPETEFFGDWELEADGNQYAISVKIA